MFLLLGHRAINMCIQQNSHPPRSTAESQPKSSPFSVLGKPPRLRNDFCVAHDARQRPSSLIDILVVESLSPIVATNPWHKQSGNRSDVRKLLFILHIPTCKLHTKNFPFKMIAHGLTTVIPHHLVHLAKTFDNCHLGHLCVRS